MIFLKKISDYVNRFIQFQVLTKQKQYPYPFVIMNIEKAGEEGSFSKDQQMID